MISSFLTIPPETAIEVRWPLLRQYDDAIAVAIVRSLNPHSITHEPSNDPDTHYQSRPCNVCGHEETLIPCMEQTSPRTFLSYTLRSLSNANQVGMLTQNTSITHIIGEPILKTKKNRSSQWQSSIYILVTFAAAIETHSRSTRRYKSLQTFPFRV